MQLVIILLKTELKYMPPPLLPLLSPPFIINPLIKMPVAEETEIIRYPGALPPSNSL